MENIVYANEFLLPGLIGSFFVFLAFAGALLALFSFVRGLNGTDTYFNVLIGRIAFHTQTIAILGVMGTMYYLLMNHHFEYEYVWRHSSTDMPFKYLISCFWAGQQGSFLLWLFWHGILGSAILMWGPKLWRNHLVGVISLAQAVILSMILGVHIPTWVGILALYFLFSFPLYYIIRGARGKAHHAFIPIIGTIKAIRANNSRATWIFAIPGFIFFLYALFQVFDPGFFHMSMSVGVNPFNLTREAFGGNAIFLNPNYLDLIDGQGLNPLLRNYWMVIHPPTLFLGFSSTIIPFAFAIVGIWRGDLKGWIKPAIPWTLFSCMILGTGIMMGGLWAYEALSFGGFWAWDPVENASFVPWLVLVAGLHTMISFKNSGYGLRITFIFLILGFFLILYSTFLTRSGILGSSSVHSFTDLGMMGQLLLLMGVMIIPALAWVFMVWKKMTTPKTEEKVNSREFWMFIGSLVLALSALQITFHTSLPVFNSINAWLISIFPSLEGARLFGIGLKTDMALPPDPVDFFNNIQIYFGIGIAIISGFAQYLKYKSTSFRRILNYLLISLGITILFVIPIYLSSDFVRVDWFLLLLMGTFSVVANLQYIFTILKGRLKFSGGSVAHTGMGIIFMALILSLGESQVISKNYLGLDFGKNFDDEYKRNNILINKNKPVDLGKYLVTYTGREEVEDILYYHLEFLELDRETGDLIDSFKLKPQLLKHPKMGLVPDPSTAHFINKDIFTHVTSIPAGSENRDPGQMEMTSYTVGLRDTFYTGAIQGILKGYVPLEMPEGTFAIKFNIEVTNLDTTLMMQPTYYINDNKPGFVAADNEKLGISLAVSEIRPETEDFVIKVAEKRDWLILKAIIFPFINLLWLGILITMVGFAISIFRRTSEIQTKKKQ